MSEFEFSTLGMLLLLLALIAGYSYWQVYRAQRALRPRQVEVEVIDEPVAVHVEPPQQWVQPPVEVAPIVSEPEIIDEPLVEQAPPPDVQFFSQQDESEHAALTVFEPLMRFAAWAQSAQPQPIHSIDGVLDIVLSQPKNNTDIERALEDLRLDFDLPLRLYGRRAGQELGVWQALETGVLYSGLRLTLQLANLTRYANSAVIQDWFVLAQKLTKRLAATVHVWPDPAALASYAVYLHDLAKNLDAPMVVQLHKTVGLWPAYEVHQHMTQWGVSLNEHGQYVAHAQDGKVLYSVLNDINNPRAQDFYKDALPTMHVNTLSFCVDLARVDVAYRPSLRLWHDLEQIAQGLQGTWCNAHNVPLDVAALMSHADIHINAYYQQLHDINIPAGSLMLRRLLRG